ncbi:type IV pilus assembly protein PilV [Thalassolituus maritimus]|uniref:Type IV pilus assembly protein PilV n=1 Tax=Thalassolituus maritimus TaxID=484498 RepID=A0A1N7IWX1_9GAMM|nr:type IV pilus modification protein PilV [Thalassolituus maritimus]SIS41486.1 type IV pilus assembly protein PilV [Thalassolituus maritimus]
MKYYMQGLGIWEVLVTLAVTTVGLLGLSALQLESIRAVSDSGNRSHAIWVASDLMNRMRANGAGIDSYLNPGDAELRCEDMPDNLLLCASTFSDAVQQEPAANCTNQTLAQFDVWEALCGTSAVLGSTEMSSSASNIVEPGLLISTVDGDVYNITISWTSRTSGTDADGNAVYYKEDGELLDQQRESYTVVFRP